MDIKKLRRKIKSLFCKHPKTGELEITTKYDDRVVAKWCEKCNSFLSLSIIRKIDKESSWEKVFEG